LKTFRKPLDKIPKVWYNNNVPRGEAKVGRVPLIERNQKNFQKLLKNPLTNQTKCAIIIVQKKTTKHFTDRLQVLKTERKRLWLTK
jgi:hypothetical protein